MSTYNKLSQEDKVIFDKVGREVSEWAFNNAKVVFEQDLQSLRDEGMTVNALNPEDFTDQSKLVYEKYGSKYMDLINQIKNM